MHITFDDDYRCPNSLSDPDRCHCESCIEYINWKKQQTELKKQNLQQRTVPYLPTKAAASNNSHYSRYIQQDLPKLTLAERVKQQRLQRILDADRAYAKIMENEQEIKAKRAYHAIRMASMIMREDQVYYRFTVYIAYPGTPLNHPKTGEPIEKVSLTGHMWYSIAEITRKGIIAEQHYGFAPKHERRPIGQGEVVTDDHKVYQTTYYIKSFEIFESYYHKLKEFGETAVKGQQDYFSLQYNGATNSCIDFVWAAMRHAGIHPILLQCKKLQNFCDSWRRYHKKMHKQFDGALLVGDNIPEIDAIPDIIPNSPYNQRINNSLPKQNLLHKAISGVESPKKTYWWQQYDGQKIGWSE